MQFRRLALMSAFYGATDLFGRGMQAIAIFMLAGLLPKSQFGDVGLLMSLQQLVMALCLGGLIEAVSGRLNQFRDDSGINLLRSKTLAAFFKASALVIAGVLGVAAFGLFPGGPASSTSSIVAATTVGIVFAYVQLQSGFHRLIEQHRKAIQTRTSAQILGYGVGILATLISPSPMTFFCGVLGGVAFAILLNFKWKKNCEIKTGASIKQSDSVSLSREGASFLVASLISWAVGYGANFFIVFRLGTPSVAEYTLVLSVMTALLMVANAVNQVWSPRFLAIAREADLVVLNFENERATRLLQVLLAITAFILLLVFPVAVKLGGPRLLAYGAIFDYLAIALVGFVSLGPYYGSMNYYLLNRNGALLARIIFIASLVGLPFWFLLVELLGNLGIYLGWSLMTITRGWAVAYIARRRWNYKFHMVQGILPVLVVAGGWAIGRNY